jgi:hypothetical protein
VALAVNYTQVRPDLNADLILTATLVSVLLFDIVASREAGEVIALATQTDDPEREAGTRPEPLPQ